MVEYTLAILETLLDDARVNIGHTAHYILCIGGYNCAGATWYLGQRVQYTED